MADILDEIRGVLKDGNAIIGTERTMKLLRQGKIKKIFLAANTNERVRGDIKHYSKIDSVAVVELGINNEELGTLCRKPFSISVIGIKVR